MYRVENTLFTSHTPTDSTKLVEIGDMVTSGAADTGKSELGHGAKR